MKLTGQVLESCSQKVTMKQKNNAKYLFGEARGLRGWCHLLETWSWVFPSKWLWKEKCSSQQKDSTPEERQLSSLLRNHQVLEKRKQVVWERWARKESLVWKDITVVLMVQPGPDPGCPSESSTAAGEEVISDVLCNLERDIFESDESQTFHAQGSPYPSLSPLTSCLTLFHLLCS